jgi:hypothetical protein
MRSRTTAEHLLDALVVDAREVRDHLEVLATGEVRVETRRLHERSDPGQSGRVARRVAHDGRRP